MKNILQLLLILFVSVNVLFGCKIEKTNSNDSVSEIQEIKEYSYERLFSYHVVEPYTKCITSKAELDYVLETICGELRKPLNNEPNQLDYLHTYYGETFFKENNIILFIPGDKKMCSGDIVKIKGNTDEIDIYFSKPDTEVYSNKLVKSISMCIECPKEVCKGTSKINCFVPETQSFETQPPETTTSVLEGKVDVAQKKVIGYIPSQKSAEYGVSNTPRVTVIKTQKDYNAYMATSRGDLTKQYVHDSDYNFYYEPGYEPYHYYIIAEVAVRGWRADRPTANSIGDVNYYKDRLEIFINETPIGYEDIDYVIFLIKIDQKYFCDNVVIIQPETQTISSPNKISNYKHYMALVEQANINSNAIVFTKKEDFDALTQTITGTDITDEYYTVSFAEIASKYDEAYFENNALVFIGDMRGIGAVCGNITYMYGNKQVIKGYHKTYIPFGEPAQTKQVYFFCHFIELPKDICDENTQFHLEPDIYLENNGTT